MDMLLMEANRVGARIIRDATDDAIAHSREMGKLKREAIRIEQERVELEQERIRLEQEGIELRKQGKRNIEHKTLRNEYIEQNERASVAQKRYGRAILTKYRINEKIKDSMERGGYYLRVSGNNTYSDLIDNRYTLNFSKKNITNQLNIQNKDMENSTK